MATSNSLYIDVLDSATIGSNPIENAGWKIKLLERDGVTNLNLLPRWREFTFSKVLSDTGAFQITIDLDDSVQAIPEVLDQVIYEFYRNGVSRFSGIAEDPEEVVVSQNEERPYTISGRGLAAMLEWTTVLPLGYPDFTLPYCYYGSVGPMSPWVDLKAAGDARGASTSPFNLTFDGSLDTAGVPWATDLALNIRPGSDMLKLLKKFTEAAGADWEVKPNFDVDVLINYGRHLEDQVRFLVTRDVLADKIQIARKGIANVVYTSSADTTDYPYVSDADSITEWGRREVFVETGNANDVATAQYFASVMLQTLKDEIPSITFKPLANNPGTEVFVDYDVGDWVYLDFDGVSLASAAYRIVAISIKVDADGYEDVEVTVSSLQQNTIIQLLRQFERDTRAANSVNSELQTPASISTPDLGSIISGGVVTGGSGTSAPGISSGDLSLITLTQGATVFASAPYGADVPNYATYTVIGNLCHIEGEIYLTADGTASSAFLLVVLIPEDVLPKNAPYAIIPDPQYIVSSGSFEFRVGNITPAPSGNILLVGQTDGLGNTAILLGLEDPTVPGDPGPAGFTAQEFDGFRFSATWEIETPLVASIGAGSGGSSAVGTPWEDFLPVVMVGSTPFDVNSTTDGYYCRASIIGNIVYGHFFIQALEDAPTDDDLSIWVPYPMRMAPVPGGGTYSPRTLNGGWFGSFEGNKDLTGQFLLNDVQDILSDGTVRTRLSFVYTSTDEVGGVGDFPNSPAVVFSPTGASGADLLTNDILHGSFWFEYDSAYGGGGGTGGSTGGGLTVSEPGVGWRTFVPRVYWNDGVDHISSDFGNGGKSLGEYLEQGDTVWYRGCIEVYDSGAGPLDLPTSGTLEIELPVLADYELRDAAGSGFGGPYTGLHFGTGMVGGHGTGANPYPVTPVDIPLTFGPGHNGNWMAVRDLDASVNYLDWFAQSGLGVGPDEIWWSIMYRKTGVTILP